jgi:hypothetical protein
MTLGEALALCGLVLIAVGVIGLLWVLDRSIDEEWP